MRKHPPQRACQQITTNLHRKMAMHDDPGTAYYAFGPCTGFCTELPCVLGLPGRQERKADATATACHDKVVTDTKGALCSENPHFRNVNVQLRTVHCHVCGWTSNNAATGCKAPVVLEV